MISLFGTTSGIRKDKPINRSDILRNIEDFIEILSSYNINVDKGSRLYRYAKIAKKIDQPESLNEWVRISLDIFQLVSLSELFKYSDISFDRDKLKPILKDAIIGNEINTQGRDLQFELFCASRWKQTGVDFEILKPPGPDFLLRANGITYLCEAKRIKNISSIFDATYKANKQLTNGKFFDGILMLDISNMFSNRIVTGESDSASSIIDNYSHIIYDYLYKEYI